MTTLASMSVRLGIDVDQLQAGANAAKKTLTGLGKAVAGLGVGVPVAAAAAAAVGGMAAAFASAGVAAKAFQLAAQPQLQDVAEVADLAAKAQEAAAKGGKEAAKAQQEYNDALADLPPATRATAREFVGLKSDFQKWSDSLSSTTMPVFTKGLQILRKLLPALTPLVKAGASALSDFLDDIGKSVDSGAVADFAKHLAGSAKKNLGAFLRSLKNVGVGVAGIIEAFLPLSDNMSGGVEKATEKFAKFGQGLKDSKGFAQFVDLAKQGAEMLGTFGQAAITLLIALGPLIGVTSQLALLLAQLINATPPGVLTAIAFGFAAISLALKAHALYTALATTATQAWTLAQTILNATLWANPYTWIVIAIVALVAAIVLIATKTNWFQRAWSASWGAIKGAALAVSGWFSGTLWPAIRGVWNNIAGAATTAKNTITGKFNDLVGFFAGMPARISKAVKGMWSGLTSGFKNTINDIIYGWNSLSFTIGGGSFLGMDFPSFTLGTPDLPYLAKGGIITDAGSAIVGERGPEMVSLPRGASVTPLPRHGSNDTPRVVIDVTGADSDLKRVVRKWVRLDGGGDVQTALGGR